MKQYPYRFILLAAPLAALLAVGCGKNEEARSNAGKKPVGAAAIPPSRRIGQPAPGTNAPAPAGAPR